MPKLEGNVTVVTTPPEQVTVTWLIVINLEIYVMIQVLLYGCDLSQILCLTLWNYDVHLE
jgi:hypothetical protein